jgi:hypothetical protein
MYIVSAGRLDNVSIADFCSRVSRRECPPEKHITAATVVDKSGIAIFTFRLCKKLGLLSAVRTMDSWRINVP